MSLPAKTKRLLRDLAEKYEVAEFMRDDPSQFLRRFAKPEEQELAAFVASGIALGRRETIIDKTMRLLRAMGDAPLEWLRSRGYKRFFDDDPKRMYHRFFSHKDFRVLLQTYAELPCSLGEYCRRRAEQGVAPEETIVETFGRSRIVPASLSSCCKRVFLFLRWMTRQNSPVDLGLWKWHSPDKLVIPLDVHVLQQAKALGIVPPNATASRKTALAITEVLREVFPGDPCKGDYALFGLGVSSQTQGK